MMINKGVSYYGSHFPEHVRKDLQEIRDHGCNYIVLAASEFDLGFYFPSMKEVVRIAHEIGLQVFLDFWAHGGTFGGEAASFFVMQNPDACQRSNKNEHLPRACFNTAKFHKFIEQSIDKCCAYLNVDGIFWDEPHFYSSYDGRTFGCFCPTCKELFSKQFGEEMPLELTSKVVSFRNNSILAFLEKYSKYVKKRTPQMLISVCSFPKERDPNGVPWDDICKIKEIDIFGSDPYWISRRTSVEYVDFVTKEVVDTAKRHGKKSEIWIQLFTMPHGREHEVMEAVRFAAKHNLDYINAWTFRAAENSVLSAGNAKLVWSTLKDAYQEISEKNPN